MEQTEQSDASMRVQKPGEIRALEGEAEWQQCDLWRVSIDMSMEGNIGEVEDIIVTNDSQLRRFQYRVADAEGHLATVDVLSVSENDTLVIYSIELGSEELVAAWGPYMDEGVRGLKRYLDDGGE